MAIIDATISDALSLNEVSHFFVLDARSGVDAIVLLDSFSAVTAGGGTIAMLDDTFTFRIPGYAFDNTALGAVDDGGSITAWVPGTTVFPAVPVDGDAFLVGHTDKFYRAWLNLTIPGTGGYEVTWEYWNGAWAALGNLISDIVEFEELKVVTGVHFVTYDVPTDWTKSTQGGVNGYWIRARTDGTGFGVVPVASVVRVGEEYPPTKFQGVPRGRARIPISWLDNATTGATGNSFIQNAKQELNPRTFQLNVSGINIADEHYPQIEAHSKQTLVHLFRHNLCVVELNGVALTETQILSATGV